MSRILSKTDGVVESRSTDSDILPATKRRLQHSAFVTTNFSHRQEIADAKLMQLLGSSVTVSEPSSSDIAVDFKIAEKNGGVAEVAFMLRAFTPEEELADAVSVALAGVQWEYDPRDNGSREW
jgi:hypothetical protein